MAKEPKPISPSRLNELAKCRCFIHASISSPAAQRGTKLDSLIRKAWTAGTTDILQAANLNSKDLRAAAWVYDQLAILASDLPSRDLIVTETKRLRVEINDIPGASGGPMDAACFYAGWTLDVKTGKMRDYTPQMAAYSYGCMVQTGKREWRTYDAFADLEILTEERFSRDQARGIITDIVDAPMVPRRCEICDRCLLKGKCEATRL